MFLNAVLEAWLEEVTDDNKLIELLMPHASFSLHCCQMNSFSCAHHLVVSFIHCGVELGLIARWPMVHSDITVHVERNETNMRTHTDGSLYANIER